LSPLALYLPFFCAAGLFAGVGGFLALLLAGGLFPGFFTGLLSEALRLILYILYLAAVSFFLAGLVRRREALAASLPFLLTACLLFCPILIDLSRYVPFASSIAAALPPTFYLRATTPAAAYLPAAALLIAIPAWRTYRPQRP